MAKAATQANTDANNDYSGWEQSALSNYNNDMGNYMSNVNGAIAEGNPYLSKSYLTNQNIQTSGAMNSAKTAAAQETRDAALRTGTNTAAVQASRDANAQALARQQTQYNAQRDTENEDKWLQLQNQLRGQQLAGANSEAGVYGTSTSGRGNALSNLQSGQNAEDQLWASGIQGLASAGGAAMTAAKV